MKHWSIIYRGPLSSCNYACDYCPFAKTKNTRQELAEDAQKLRRFTQWVSERKEQISVLFTPWGEALIRKHYQEAMHQLSWMPNVQKVAIQTNISCSLDWLDGVNKKRLALWTTYHPSQISLEKFAAQCQILDQKKIRYSVGFVGFKNELKALHELRKAIDPSIYVWVNAYKRETDYYEEKHLQEILSIDPLFLDNTQYHPSKGKACRAGNTMFSLDGDGNIQSCHFIKQRIGNIYEPDFEQVLYPRNCSNDCCGCHIGYVHLESLNLYERYEDGVLERIPKIWPIN